MTEKMKKLLVTIITMALSVVILSGCNKEAPVQQAEKPQEKPVANENEYEDDEYYDDEDGYYEDEDEYFEDEEFVEEERIEEPEVKEPEKDTSDQTDVVGKWYTEDYDEDANWAMSYVIELTADGKAACTGWRNKDNGTYKVNNGRVLITFDDCQTDEPGEGFKTVKDFKYTIEMIPDGNDATIKIDAPDVISNLEDGKVHRKDSGSSASKSDDAKSDSSGSSEIADGSYLTDSKYSGELSGDASKLVIETGLSHYDKDWNTIKDYDKQKIELNISKNCKCVIMQEDVSTYPIKEKIDFINEFLGSNSGLPIGLIIKNGELVEINFSS